MLVYGDPDFPLRRDTLVSRLHEHLRGGTLAILRAALILAGQWEQGVADSGHDACAAERLTDAAAGVFLRRWREEPWDAAAVSAALETLPAAPGEVRARVPEGYAFYALYPEQYAAAAQAWAAEQDRTAPVLVVGVRTIGTSLSAVVCATLRRLGFAAQRMTVRPSGPPFERVVDLPVLSEAPALALVVDEGPGLSGSSMAAAAEALERAGLPGRQITFLTAHDHLPGRFGSEPVRRRWEATARLAAGSFEPAWDGVRLSTALAKESMVLASGAAVHEIQSLGQPPFGRPRIRISLYDGSAYVWKFYGTCAVDDSAAPADLLAYDQIGLGSYCGRPEEPLHGWLPFAWAEGVPLTSDDRPLILTRMLGRHLRQRLRPPLNPPEQERSLARLREMLAVNLPEGLPAALAARLLPKAERIRVAAGVPTAGDYRMGPEHWIRTEHRILVKVSGGYPADHTLVGEQPFFWDLAGAAVEWELAPAEVREVAAAAELPVDPDALWFYRVAYAAFRMGQCRMAAASVSEAERPPLAEAAERFRRLLCDFAQEA